MFKIGEFSKIAQVSGRLLRYYDEIGLLTPAHIDRFTGYRYYTIEQLPRLNRILALKDLGLSLDQIARMLSDDVASDEIRGMLNLKKAQIEQTLQDEMGRLRRVEARLHQIENEGRLGEYDVVIKSVPSQVVLSLRTVLPSLEAGKALFQNVYAAARPNKNLGSCIVVTHSEVFEPEDIDVELGFVVEDEIGNSLMIPGSDLQLTRRALPAVESMATLLHVGDLHGGMSAFAALGAWVAANDYLLVGPGREVLLQVGDLDQGADVVLELQFPIEKATSPNDLIFP